MVVGGTRAVNQAAEAMKRLLPYLLIVILGISLLGALVYSRLITRPIVALSRIARRMAEQDFDARWQRRRRDEIGVLGDSLNLLSENLSTALAQLRQANLALQGDIDRERELDRQRTAFFAAASHELKTPVTILKGQLSGMLAQVGVYRDREKYLARALEVTARMEGLIREILTISRIGSGGYALKREQVDLSARMEEVLCQNSELIERRGLRVLREIAPGVTVLGSASLLSNALDNVLMNAILYSGGCDAAGAGLGGRAVRDQRRRLDSQCAACPSVRALLPGGAVSKPRVGRQWIGAVSGAQHPGVARRRLLA